ncbi:GNAT family N-acetyltransferase [Kitasatospora sp. NPDC001683]
MRGLTRPRAPPRLAPTPGARSASSRSHSAQRARGLGTWLAEAVVEHLRPYALKRLLLSTVDAHEVYAKAGFVPFPDPHKLMVLGGPKPG